MSMVTCDMAMSVDGFVAGPGQSREEPFGEGVDGRLHRWMFEEPDAHADEIAAITAAGAYVMGRNIRCRARSVGPRLEGLVGRRAPIPRARVRPHPS